MRKKIPDSYKNVVKRHIISDTDIKLGKIKYDDKILHRSRVLRYFTENKTPTKKTQKDLDNVYKKIKKIETISFLQKI